MKIATLCAMVALLGSTPEPPVCGKGKVNGAKLDFTPECVEPAAGGAVQCKDEIDKQWRADGAKNEVTRIQSKTVLEEHCDDSDIVCLSATGVHINADKTRKRFRPGHTIKVRVIGCSELNDKVTFKIVAKNVTSSDRLFKHDPSADAAPKPNPKAAQGVGLERQCERLRMCTKDADITVLEELPFTIAKDDALQNIEIAFSADRSKATHNTSTDAVKTTNSFPVVQGRYYVDLGLLVPFTFRGERNVVGEELPGSGAQRLAVEHEMPTPALAAMLNVFPGGRRVGIFQSFAEQKRCIAPGRRACRKINRQRGAANSLGFQLGLDLDFTDPADAFYLGTLFEPISGLSFNAGLSVRKGEFLRAGQREGQLIVEDSDLTPKIWPIARPYVGVTLSLDIVRALIAFSGRARTATTSGAN